MKRLQDLPISRRVTIVILLMFCFVLLAATAGISIYQTVALKRRAVSELRNSAELVGIAVETYVLSRLDTPQDQAATRAVLARLQAGTDVDVAQIYRADERSAFASLPADANLPDFVAAANEGHWFDASGLWLVASPRGETGERYGRIVLHSSMKALTAELRNSLVILGVIMVVMLALSYAFGRYLKHSLIGPLSALAATVHQIADKKDHRLRAPKLSNDEVGSLAADFNAMLSALETQAAILRESEERYRLLTENSTNYITELDDAMCFQYVGPNFRDFGYEPGELAGRLCSELVHKDDWAKIEPKLRQSSSSAVYRFRHKDGSWRWLESSAQNFKASSGQERRVVVSRDITDRIRAEEEKTKLESQLRQAQKMEAIGTLAGGIAHDFNNILASIIPYTQLAMEDLKGNQEARESLQEVLKAAERAKSLVQQILAFSRKQPQQHSIVRLQPLVKEALKLIRSALPSSIEIVTSIAEDVSPVLADPGQLHQVLMNLCTNSAQAMKNRPGRIEVSLTPFRVDTEFCVQLADLSPGEHVRLTISDNGHGMSTEVMKRIFDPFFTTKAPGEGTGLGLSVVHGIVKAHHGAIQVYSRIGEGTTFHVFLPARKEVSDTSFIDRAALPLPRGKGQHILFVDDEAPICATAQRIVEKLGYRVTTFSDPEFALQGFRAQPEKFDLVLTDLTMPKLSGLTLAAEISRIRPGLPIILASGYIGVANNADLRRAGIRETVSKPISAELYADVLERCFSAVASPTDGHP